MNVRMFRACGRSAFLLVAAVPLLAFAGSQFGADYFGDVRLTTQDGKEVRFYDDLIKGKSVAINVIYTSCTDECPLETARMAEVQRLLGDRMGKDIQFYSISIDPEKDTPKVLKDYSGKFGVGPGWLFLTGKKDDIKQLTKKLGLSRNSDAISKDGHASSLMLGNDPTGQWMRSSAVDNPRFLAATMGTFFSWKDTALTSGYAQAKAVDIGKAQFTFESKCSSCHTVGGGDRIGPDLMGVTSRRSNAWLTRYLKEPDKMLAEGDVMAKTLHEKYRQVNMPNLGLGVDDVSALIAYLDNQSKKALAQKAAPPGSADAHAHHHNH